MACSIKILSVTADAVPGQPVTSVTVTGTASECSNIKVSLSGCVTPPISVSTSVVNGNWTLTFTGPFPLCRCDSASSRILVKATCVEHPECDADATLFPIPCRSGCCPTVTLQPGVPGPCDASGKRPVSFAISVIPATGSGCPSPIFVTLDWGDGASTSFIVPPSPQTPMQHAYLPGTYTATVKVLYPTGCPATSVEVQVPVCPPCTCPTLGAITGSKCLGAGQAASFAVEVTDPDHCIKKYSWVLTRQQGLCDTECNVSTPNAVVVTTPTPTVSLPTTLAPGNWDLVVVAYDVSPCCQGCALPLASKSMQFSITPGACPGISSFEAVRISTSSSGFTYEYTTTFAGDTSGAKATWNWGDGATESHCLCGAPSITSTHNYPCSDAGETVSASVVLESGNDCCPVQQAAISFDLPDGCGDCFTGFRSWLCPLLEKVFGWALGLGLALLILFSCTGITVLGTIAVVVLGIAVLALILYLIFCTKCAPCGWFWLLLWRTFFIVAILLLVFSACPLSVCNLGAIGLILLIVALLALVLWILICRPTLCQVLDEIITTYTVGLVPAVTFALGYLKSCVWYLVFGPFIIAFWGIVAAIFAGLVLYRNTQCKSVGK